MNDSKGIVAAHGTVLWFSLFEYVCEALADSFMRFFWDFGFQMSFALLSMVLFGHILIRCMFHIFTILYELKLRYVNSPTVNLGYPNVPAFTPVFMDRKRANSRMFYV